MEPDYELELSDAIERINRGEKLTDEFLQDVFDRYHEQDVTAHLRYCEEFDAWYETILGVCLYQLIKKTN